MHEANNATKRWPTAIQVVLLLSLGLTPCWSRAQSTYGEEATVRMQTALRTDPLTDGSFGERINLYNGTASFRFVDVSLPSSNSLKVEFARLIDDDFSLNFSGWIVDVPSVTSILPANWEGGWTPDPPDFFSNPDGVEFRRKDYWNGFRLKVEGNTSQLLYRSNDSRLVTTPGGGNFRFMTKASWTFEVVPASGGVGSSLIGYAPNGNRYYFDHLVTDEFGGVDHQTEFNIVPFTPNPNATGSTVYPAVLRRSMYVLYVSKIQDRFGNWVRYEWDGPKLNRIHANDGREIVIISERTNPGGPSEDPMHVVRQVTANGLTWTYGPGNEVVNPDGSKWQGVVSSPRHIQYKRTVPAFIGGNLVHLSLLHDILPCVKAYDFLDNQGRRLSITHPSGATATYEFEPERHGRTNVPNRCRARSDDTRTWNNALPMYDDTWTLFRKTVSGPGIPTLVTSYSYEGLEPQFAASAEWEVSAPPNLKTVTVRESGGEFKKYVFGRDWALNEGQLFSVSEYDAQNTLQRRTDHTYLPTENTFQAFPPSFGGTGIAQSDQLGSKNLPMISTVVTQDSHYFSWQVSADCNGYCFDYLVRPTKVIKSSAATAPPPQTPPTQPPPTQPPPTEPPPTQPPPTQPPPTQPPPPRPPRPPPTGPCPGCPLP